LEDEQSIATLKQVYKNIFNSTKGNIESFCAICTNFSDKNDEFKQYCEESQIIILCINQDSFSENNDLLKILYSWLILKKSRFLKTKTAKIKKLQIDECNYKKQYNIKPIEQVKIKSFIKYSL
jgi:hypothetical protein